MRLLVGIVLCVASMYGQSLRVAITFDDLPRGGDSADGRDAQSIQRLTTRLLAAMKNVPVAGFVNAGRAEAIGADGLQDVLKLWCEHPAILGNHSYSHPDLNRVTLTEYTADILKGEPAITNACGRRPTYFRHPFLHAGKDAATKAGLEVFLKDHGYRVAPVTLDNSDYIFAALYVDALKHDEALARRIRIAYLSYMDSIFAFFEARAIKVVGRPFPQILLLHANQLNADVMPDLLTMMKRRGYTFVSLDAALQDAAYQLPDNYAGPGGFSWIHRWSMTMKMPGEAEPDPPVWIMQLFENRAHR